MNLDLTDIAARIQRAKEASVLDSPPHQHSDLPPFMIVYREDRARAEIAAMEVDRDQGLRLAAGAIRGYVADAIVFATDSYAVNAPVNPMTGQSWGPGEMQKLWDQRDKYPGVVSEAMQMTALARDGAWALGMLLYEADRAARKVHWRDLEQMAGGEEGTHMEGFVPDVLRQAFQDGPLVPPEVMNMGAEVFGLGEKRTRIHTDLAVTQMLTELGAMVALIPWDPEEEVVMEESHQRWSQQQLGRATRAERRRQERAKQKGPRSFVVKASDIARCPIHSLSPRHYRNDGSCRCDETEGEA